MKRKSSIFLASFLLSALIAGADTVQPRPARKDNPVVEYNYYPYAPTTPTYKVTTETEGTTEVLIYTITTTAPSYAKGVNKKDANDIVAQYELPVEADLTISLYEGNKMVASQEAIPGQQVTFTRQDLLPGDYSYTVSASYKGNEGEKSSVLKFTVKDEEEENPESPSYIAVVEKDTYKTLGEWRKGMDYGTFNLTSPLTYFHLQNEEGENASICWGPYKDWGILLSLATETNPTSQAVTTSDFNWFSNGFIGYVAFTVNLESNLMKLYPLEIYDFLIGEPTLKTLYDSDEKTIKLEMTIPAEGLTFDTVNNQKISNAVPEGTIFTVTVTEDANGISKELTIPYDEDVAGFVETLTITDIVPNTEYAFDVAVKGKYASMKYVCESGKITFNTTSAEKVYGAPINVQAENADGKIRVTWDAPSANTVEISGYNIYLFSDESAVKVKQNDDLVSTRHSFSFDTPVPETNSLTYYITVEAVYSDGTRQMSEPASFDVTEIAGIEAGNEGGEDTYYDLLGRKIEKPQHGIYLQMRNGKASKRIRR